MRSVVMAAVLAIVVAVAIGYAVSGKKTPALTPADVEQVTSVTNVRVVTHAGTAVDPKSADASDLEFADMRGQTILRLNFISMADFKKAKEQKEIDVNGRKIPAVLFNAPVPGIGDEAFDGPKGPMQTFIYFRKGKRAALLSAVQAAHLRLTPDDLRALAKIAASRF